MFQKTKSLNQTLNINGFYEFISKNILGASLNNVMSNLIENADFIAITEDEEYKKLYGYCITVRYNGLFLHLRFVVGLCWKLEIELLRIDEVRNFRDYLCRRCQYINADFWIDPKSSISMQYEKTGQNHHTITFFKELDNDLIKKVMAIVLKSDRITGMANAG